MKSKPFIDHLSYSATRSFMTSPLKFWKEYVIREEFKPNLTVFMGQCWHKGLEYFLLSGDTDLKKIEEFFNKGKVKLLERITGEELEEMNKDLDKELKALKENLLIYFALKIEWQSSGVVERKISMPSPVEGGLPITGVIDVVDVAGNPIDHKYVSRFTTDGPDKYLVQAWFNYYLVKELTGKYPGYFRISEFKKVPNRNKESQLKEIIVIYEAPWMKRIDQWYKEISEQILKQIHFLPNPFSFFDNADWLEYINS